MIEVDAFSSTTTNARQIRDAIVPIEPDSCEPRLVLIGCSTGAPDILEAILRFVVDDLDAKRQ